MKRLILSATFTLILGTAAFGDIGTINFINSINTRVTLQGPFGQDLGLMPGVLGQFIFQLYVAPAGTTDRFQFVPTNIRGTNLAAPGRFTGGFNLGVSGVQAGETRSILVRGWSTSLGDDYDTAFANWGYGWGPGSGFLGESQIAPGFVFGGFDGVGPIPPSPAFGGAFGIQNGFALVGVPEPSAFALFGPGIALLLASHRHWRAGSIASTDRKSPGGSRQS